jgi:hypothetical protein
VLEQKLVPSSCASCLRDLVSKVRIIYNEYKEEQTTEENADTETK